jgi:hypothetical protein
MKSLKTRRAMARIRQQVHASMVAGEFDDVLGPAVGDACNPPFSQNIKYAARDITLPAAVVGTPGTGTIRITTPGSFCPLQMYIIADDIDGVDMLPSIFVTSIKNGLDEQMISTTISGSVGGMLLPASLFGPENHCCQHACMRCLCKPGVPFEVSLANAAGAPVHVTVVLVGVYTDLYPMPNTLADMPPVCEPHNTKYVGFAVNLASGEDETVHIETPGKYCATGMFLQTTTELFGIITSIKAGTKQQIISGTLDMSLFTKANKCCSLNCFDCLCKPGYPLEITFHNDNPEGPLVVFGALVGSYEEVC